MATVAVKSLMFTLMSCAPFPAACTRLVPAKEKRKKNTLRKLHGKLARIEDVPVVVGRQRSLVVGTDALDLDFDLQFAVGELRDFRGNVLNSNVHQLLTTVRCACLQGGVFAQDEQADASHEE